MNLVPVLRYTLQETGEAFGLCLSVETPYKHWRWIPASRRDITLSSGSHRQHVSTLRHSKSSELINKNPGEKNPAMGFVALIAATDKTQLANNVHSCSRYRVAAGRLSSERPGNVTSVSKTFPLTGYNHCFSHRTFLKRIKKNLAVPAQCLPSHYLNSSHPPPKIRD